MMMHALGWLLDCYVTRGAVRGETDIKHIVFRPSLYILERVRSIKCCASAGYLTAAMAVLVGPTGYVQAVDNNARARRAVK